MKLFQEASRLAESAEVYIKNEENLRVHLESKQVHSIQADHQLGRALRIFQNGRLGFAHTTQTGPQADKDLLRQALAIAPYGKSVNFELPQNSFQSTNSLTEQEIKKISEENIVQIAFEIVESLQNHHPLIGWSVILNYQHGNIQLVNNKGFDGYYNFTNLEVIAAGMYVQEGDILHYHRKWLSKQVPRYKDIQTWTSSVDRDLAKFERIVKVMPGTYQILFSPSAVETLLRTVVVPITGQNLTRSQILLKNLGNRILDPRITLIDDPTHASGSRSVPFDDEGITTRSRYLFKNGLFTEGIHSLSTASTVGHQPTGNGFRLNYAKMPRPKATNLLLLPGKQRFSDMLSNIKQGIYVVEIGGESKSNFRNGRLTGIINLGYKIVNGERVGRIKNVALNLDGFAALQRQIIALSVEREWSNNGMLPAVAIDGVEIGVLS